MNSPRTAAFYKPHGVFSPVRTATVIEKITGKFTTWRIGMQVRVVSANGEFCCIERMKWKGQLPLNNACAGVPRTSLDFD